MDVVALQTIALSIGPLADVPVWRLLFGLAVVALAMFGFLYRMAFVSAMYSSDPTAHEGKVNCPSCGARTTPEPASCDYCREPLPEESTMGSG